MAIDYCIEKFQRAVDALADSIDPWQERLLSAFLCMHVLQMKGNVPPDLEPRVAALFKRLTRVEAKADEGNVQATINVMSDREGAEIIHEICSINDHLFIAYRF